MDYIIDNNRIKNIKNFQNIVDLRIKYDKKRKDKSEYPVKELEYRSYILNFIKYHPFLLSFYNDDTRFIRFFLKKDHAILFHASGRLQNYLKMKTCAIKNKYISKKDQTIFKNSRACVIYLKCNKPHISESLLV